MEALADALPKLPPEREALQHAETMMLPAVPDLPPRPGSSTQLPAMPDLAADQKPPPPKAAVNSFALSPPPPPPPPPPTSATVELAPCPTCGARLTVNAEDVGAHVECPMCKTVFEGKAGTDTGKVPTVVAPLPEPPSNDVDIAPCPKCKSELTVAEEDVGKEVECPHCQTVYVAERPKAKSGTTLAKSVRRPDAPPPPSKADDDSKKKPYTFKPKKEKKKDSPFLEDDEDDDDRPKKKSSRRRDDDDDEDERPSRRRSSRRDDDDDDDDDDRPRKKRRRSGGLKDDRYKSVAPHDGVLNLVLAIVAFFVNGGGFLCCNCLYILPPILAIYVIIKASLSLNEIKKGLMDESGKVMLIIALILAILTLVITVAAILLQVVFAAAVFGSGGMGGGGGGGGFRDDDDF